MSANDASGSGSGSSGSGSGSSGSASGSGSSGSSSGTTGESASVLIAEDLSNASWSADMDGGASFEVPDSPPGGTGAAQTIDDGSGIKTPDQVFTSAIPWVVSGTTNVPGTVVVIIDNLPVLTQVVSTPGAFNFTFATQADANGSVTPLVSFFDAGNNTLATNTTTVQETKLSWAFSNDTATEEGLASFAIPMLVDGLVQPIIDGLKSNASVMASEMSQNTGIPYANCLDTVNQNIDAYKAALKQEGVQLMNSGMTTAGTSGTQFDLLTAANNPHLPALTAFINQLQTGSQNPQEFSLFGSIQVNNTSTNLAAFLESPTTQDAITLAKNTLSATVGCQWNVQTANGLLQAKIEADGLNYSSKDARIDAVKIIQSFTPQSWFGVLPAPTFSLEIDTIFKDQSSDPAWEVDGRVFVNF